MTTLGSIEHDRPLDILAILGDCQTAGRLAALGVLPGCRVRVVRTAPLKDPIAMLLDSQEISIRRKDANLIEVREPQP